MQLGGIVAVRKRIAAVPVCTSSTTSICIQITGISCRSSSSRPPLGISAAKPVGGARTGRVWTSWRRRYLGRSSSLEGSPPNAPRTFPPERAQNGRRCAPRSCSATRWPRRVVCGGRGRPGLTRASKGQALPVCRWPPSRALLGERRPQEPDLPPCRYPPAVERRRQRRLPAEQRGRRRTHRCAAPPSWVDCSRRSFAAFTTRNERH